LCRNRRQHALRSIGVVDRREELVNDRLIRRGVRAIA
jgi:hypothetical protein